VVHYRSNRIAAEHLPRDEVERLQNAALLRAVVRPTVSARLLV
jgi:hypothetical protein